MLEGMYGKNIFLPISCLFFCKLYIPSFFFKSKSLWCSIERSSTKNLLQSFSFYKPKNLFNLHKIILLYHEQRWTHLQIVNRCLNFAKKMPNFRKSHFRYFEGGFYIKGNAFSLNRVPWEKLDSLVHFLLKTKWIKFIACEL